MLKDEVSLIFVRNKFKIFTYSILWIPIVETLSVIALIYIISGGNKSFLYDKTLIAMVYIFSVFGYVTIKFIIIKNKYDKYVTNKICDIRKENGYDVNINSDVTYIFNRKDNGLYYDAGKKVFLLIWHGDRNPDKYKIRWILFGLNEIKYYELHLSPPSLNNILLNNKSKYGLAGALRFGLGGAIVGLLVGDMFDEFKSVKIKFSVTFKFNTHDDNAFEYKPIDTDHTLRGKILINNFVNEKIEALYKAIDIMTSIGITSR
jgi:hypothetical protein